MSETTATRKGSYNRKVSATLPSFESTENPVEVQEPVKERASWPILDDNQISLLKTTVSQISPFLQIFKFEPENTNQVFVFRNSSVSNWKQLMLSILDIERKEGALTPQQQDEMICNEFTVWPNIPTNFWDNTLAGIVTTLAQQIREKSGFPLVRDDGTIVKETIRVEPIGNQEVKEIEEPSEDEIAKFEESSCTGQVFRVSFSTVGGIHYIKPITRGFYSEVQRKMENETIIDLAYEICKGAVVWSTEDWSGGNIIAGVCESIFSEILLRSGFESVASVTAL